MFYRSKHIGANLKHNVWTADVPPGAKLVHFVTDFSDTNVLTESLNAGYLVVSRPHSEVGIEYLAPYRLVVACVQCKFVKEGVSWSEISKKMVIAVAHGWKRSRSATFR
jgi:hypothetical protein